MRNLTTLLAFGFITIHISAQYCEPNSNCNFGDYIDNVTFNTINNIGTAGSNCNDGAYTFYDNLSTTVTTGASVDLTLLPSTQYPQGFSVWIDYNQNEIFETSEQIYASPGVGSIEVSSTVIIPTDASLGETRMRVRCRYNNTISGGEACTNFNYGETEDYLVNIVAPGPPVSDFTANTTVSCNGWIQFENLATNGVSYIWDFGDGNTSTDPDPLHQYIATGIYSVSLIAINSEGNDTSEVSDYIEIDFTQSPVAASCSPETGTGNLGFGITSFIFNTINHSSVDAIEGYQDLVCDYSTDVIAGSPYSVSIGNSNSNSQNIAVYIDYNGDGDFNDANELAYSAESVTNVSGSIVIPATANLNSFLRLRVIADYDFNPLPGPCTDPQYGQAEDYSVRVTPNSTPPQSDFNMSTNLSCNGEIEFTDASLYSPDTWAWSFGDGGTSTDQDPVYTYSNNGDYTVQLIVENSFGADTLTQDVTIDLDGNVLAASCTPSTLGYCCEYGITRVVLGSINNSTSNGEEGYQDFSCSYYETLVQGTEYTITVNTGGTNPHDVYVWVDMNNDGVFDASTEIIYTAINEINPSGTFTLPIATTAVYDTKVRMRVSADFTGSSLNPCASPFYGQVEDYGIVIGEPVLPPSADFMVNNTNTCNGEVQFTDLSNDNPEEWSWDFGDGNSSTDQNPSHIYEGNGSYTVSLTATNSNGSDTETKPNYVNVNFTTTCDTVVFSDNAMDTLNYCNGVFVDNGGVTADYNNGINSQITIAPDGASSITLQFQSFETEDFTDEFKIYDGPSTSSTLLGTYSGFMLPEGGTVSSSGGAITIVFESNEFWTLSGFVGTFTCAVGIEDPELLNSLNAYPNPSNGNVTLTWSEFDENIIIEVVDLLGKLIHKESIDAGLGQTTFQLNDVEAGLYHITVQAKSTIKSIPLTIIK